MNPKTSAGNGKKCGMRKIYIYIGLLASPILCVILHLVHFSEDASTVEVISDVLKAQKLSMIQNQNTELDNGNPTISTVPQVKDRNSSNQKEHHQFAYAFLMAGCIPEKPSYMGYIYNIIVSKELLKRYNSTADVIVMIRMHKDTPHTTLPPKHETLLQEMGVIIKYLPKPLTDNFHTAMMDKFRVLELTEYERILYLDSDTMPMNNLDYMFEKSIGPDAALQENVALTFNHEPASGGFFMLKPNKEDYIELVKIIDRREEMGYHFNETIGWGHVITPPDYWESFKKNGTKWNFYGAFTDQGLLYHWMKYVKKNVTLIRGNGVKTWKADGNGNVKMIREQKGTDIFGDVTRHGTVYQHLQSGMDNTVPYRDFKHFTQLAKPWLKGTAKKPPPIVENIKDVRYPVQLWYHILRQLNSEHNFGINTEHLSLKLPSLGLTPTHNMVMMTNDAKKNNTLDKNRSEVKVVSKN
jgi:alpha-N-acetylglucosamine transferase